MWSSATEHVTVYPNNVYIDIQLYMKDSDQKPNEKIFKTIVSELKAKENIPYGNYRITLNDNKINENSADSDTTDSLETGTKNGFIKH